MEKISLELQRKIKEAVMCCSESNESECSICPYKECKFCAFKILSDTFTVISFYEKRINEIENGYKGTSFLDSCKLHDALEIIEKQKRKIEFLEKSIEGARRWINR